MNVPCDEHEGPLGPPRFSLRMMFLAVTVLGCLFAAMAALGSFWSLVILLFAALVAAHVIGNAVGTRLRDRSPGLKPRIALERPVAAAALSAVAAPRRLTERQGLDRIALATAAATAAGGGSLGGIGSLVLYPDAGPAAILLGTASLAVFGALFGFLASSFLRVFRAAMRKALDKPPSS